MMSEREVLQVHGVTKKIGSKIILDNVSLSVQEGEIFGLLGPNGSGKTTLIRTVVGLVSSTGDVIINNKDLRKQFNEAVKSIGAIIENPEFYGYLTGYQNLKHFARMHGVSASRIDEVVKLTRLEKSIHQPVKTYSLGMRQRLGVAQAILHKPSLLLLDEPTNGLDPAGMIEFKAYLKQLCKEEGISILIASHLLKEVEALCDRVGIIQEGKLLSVQELANRNTAERVTIVFAVSALEQAEKLLLAKGYTCVIKENQLSVQAQPKEAATINKLLVEEGIEVYQITPIYESLEQSFMSVTGGDFNA